MSPVHPLALIPTEPGGPARGEGLRIDEEEVAVVRRRPLRRGVVARRPRGGLTRWAAGPPAALAPVTWLSPGARIAVEGRVAAPGADDGGHLLALEVPGPVTPQTWLLHGTPGAVADAVRALAGADAPPAAGGGTSGHGPARRTVAAPLLALVAAGAVGLAVVTQADRAGEYARSVRSVLT
ncbi:MAG TPA: hypothetical protein VNT51_14610, partial [Miltoncostaeaceae bacterium]|nr:hypothetical protein [Miltoncostaeaceae bacterium]